MITGHDIQTFIPPLFSLGFDERRVVKYQSLAMTAHKAIPLFLAAMGLLLTANALALNPAIAQSNPSISETALREALYYKMSTVPIPEGIVLEVGGLATLRDGRLAVTTRRGNVWLIENPDMENGSSPHYIRFAQGLHEPLGVAQKGSALYVVQRPELTRLEDTNGDDRADRYESVYSWPLSGNYHEYAYGPVFLPDGSMAVALNLAWIGHGSSPVEWRGWMLNIKPDGKMTPIASGMRSPAGLGLNKEGDLFYAENQGDWVGSGRITHVEKGDFVGNPASLAWTDLPNTPLDLEPQDVPDTGAPMHEAAESVPELKLPAAWLPHGIMGTSTSDILVDTVGGAFGPFAGQLFVGDQGHKKIMRLALEKVKGEYQGALFPFREGFDSGILRMSWSRDGLSMYVGMTSRGWSGTGNKPYGLQRLTWTGKTPFEVKTLHARPDGFELTFTRPVDPETANNLDSYDVTGFTYKYHHNYGSPIINRQSNPVRGVAVSDDGRRVRVALDGLRRGYVHELKLDGLRSEAGRPLLHDTAYYTLNNIPVGPDLARNDMTAEAAGETTPGASQSASSSQELTSNLDDQPKHRTELPAAWTGGPDTTVTIGTRPGMRYDLEFFPVPAGSRVRLVFDNDDDVLHNLSIVLPGTWEDVADQAIEMGIEGPEEGYIPETDKILFHTSLLEPGTSESIYFTAPDDPDDYTYVCTFPGHAETMQGTMRVVPASNVAE